MFQAVHADKSVNNVRKNLMIHLFIAKDEFFCSAKFQGQRSEVKVNIDPQVKTM